RSIPERAPSWRTRHLGPQHRTAAQYSFYPGRILFYVPSHNQYYRKMKKMKFLCWFFISAGLMVGCANDSEKEPIETDPITFTKEGELSIYEPSGTLIKELDIEIADDNYERETGLMYRESMEDEQGMLFIFENA